MEKIGLKIRLFGDPLLRKKANPVKEITDYHRQALNEMAQLMYAASGIGLAGPQVGISQTLIVLDIGTGLYKLVNPRISLREDRQVLEEGCLSIPGVCIKVKRAGKVSVEAQDESGNPVTVKAEGLLACVFQHEIDHLSGKTIVDYASLFEKMKIKKKLAKMKNKLENEELPESKTKSCKLQL